MPAPTPTPKRPVAPAVDYSAAIVLLRQALGKSVTVTVAPGAAYGADAIVQVPSYGAVKLRLVPHGSRVPRPAGRIVWVIPRGTKALRQLLRQRDEQFVDLSGAVRIVEVPFFVDRDDLAPVRDTSPFRQGADPFADKGSMVLRVMLEQRDVTTRVWGIRELASAAKVALATASDVVRGLAQRGLVDVARAGRSAEVAIRDPWQVMHAWSRAYDVRLNRGVILDAPVGDPSTFLPRLANAMHASLPKDARWALTTHAGASLVSPFATWDRIHLYVDGWKIPRSPGLGIVAAKTGWRPSPTGKLVVMVPHYTNSVWHGLRRVRRFPVVSDLQLALDLWHYPVRGREQADVILQRMFGPEPGRRA